MQGIDNFVEQETGTTGTGDLSLSSVNGGRDFSAAFTTGGTDEFFYSIWHPNVANEYEFGLGHLVDSTTLARDTVIDSSNSDSLVSFSSGTKKIICDVPAERILDKNRLQGYLQPDGLVIANNSTNPNTDIDVSIGGNVWVHDPADESTGIVVDSPIASPAVQLDTSGVGGRLNSTLDASQRYEPGVIASADGELVDYVAWKPANRPTQSSDLPSGYDYFRPMGTPGKTWWIKTDGSSNIRSFINTSNGFYTHTFSELQNFNPLFSQSPGPGSATSVNISSQLPPVKSRVVFNRFGTSSGVGAIDSVDFGTSIDEAEAVVGVQTQVTISPVENQEIYLAEDGGDDGLILRYVKSFKAVE